MPAAATIKLPPPVSSDRPGSELGSSASARHDRRRCRRVVLQPVSAQPSPARHVPARPVTASHRTLPHHVASRHVACACVTSTSVGVTSQYGWLVLPCRCVFVITVQLNTAPAETKFSEAFSACVDKCFALTVPFAFVSAVLAVNRSVTAMTRRTEPIYLNGTVSDSRQFKVVCVSDDRGIRLNPWGLNLTPCATATHPALVTPPRRSVSAWSFAL